jgi:hypothetical protein
MFKKNQIKFCNKKASLIDNYVLLEVCKQLKFKYNYHFTKPTYEILNKSNVSQIKENPHLVSFDIKGNDFILFLTSIKGKKYCLFIEQKNENNIKMYSVKFRFDSDLYDGTIFEGKLTMNNKECWIFIINNIYCERSNMLSNQLFSKKLNRITTILKTKYKYDDFMNVCHIQVQSFFLYHHLEMIKKNTKKELIFNSEYDDQKYKYYLNEVSKEILSSNQKKDSVFEIRKTNLPDVYELWYYKNNSLVKNSIATISTMKTSLFVRGLFEQNKNKPNYVLCKYKDSFGIKGWIPYKSSTKDKLSIL